MRRQSRLRRHETQAGFALACVTLLAACAPAAPARLAPSPVMPAVRAYNSAEKRMVPFDKLIAKAARADVVFFGEQHDDAETHFAEFALLEGIGRVRSNVVLSLEMFERDVQAVLDDYLAGRTSEADFLAKSRPWPQYATDYRQLVLLARARGWPVVASNVPRAIASAVSRKGLAALDTLPAASRAHVARDIACPHDDYYARFAEEMKTHGNGGPGSAPDTAAARVTTDRFYEAQCIKDETMGESIAQALARAGAGAIVVHFDGAFHSDFGLGTAARAVRRIAKPRSVTISAVPVADPATATVAQYAPRADFVLLTKKPVPVR
jgi:uncharacterized iron-regulated protein